MDAGQECSKHRGSDGGPRSERQALVCAGQQ